MSAFLKAKKKITAKKKKHPFIEEAFKIFAVVLGGFIVASGLEFFLIPNGFLDGGVTGASIILSNFINIPVGVFIGILNIPFIILTFTHSGVKTAVRTVLGVASLSVSTIILHHVEPLTTEFALALGYGGLCLGLGMGIALKYGGALDGTEALAVIVSNKSRFSVEQLILLINCVIFIVAAIVISPQSAMASMLLFYVVVAPIIKKVVDGGSELKMTQIITTCPSEVQAFLDEKMHRSHTRIDNITHFSQSDKNESPASMITVMVARIEESNLVDSISDIDSDAVLIFHDGVNIKGGVYETDDKH